VMLRPHPSSAHATLHRRLAIVGRVGDLGSLSAGVASNDEDRVVARFPDDFRPVTSALRTEKWGGRNASERRVIVNHAVVCRSKYRAMRSRCPNKYGVNELARRAARRQTALLSRSGTTPSKNWITRRGTARTALKCYMLMGWCVVTVGA
jgi:hypothetical protein